jgi:putative endonuclease
MYKVYILKSTRTGKFYIGYTGVELTLRLERHNSGGTASTKSGIPWELVYCEQFQEKGQAIRRERELKSWKSHRSIEELIVWL